MEMVFDAREDYERRLVAVAPSQGVERLAQQYVDELRPCYEWQGLHGRKDNYEERSREAARSRLARNLH